MNKKDSIVLRVSDTDEYKKKVEWWSMLGDKLYGDHVICFSDEVPGVLMLLYKQAMQVRKRIEAGIGKE